MYKGLHPIIRHNETTIFVMAKLKGTNSLYLTFTYKKWESPRKRNIITFWLTIIIDRYVYHWTFLNIYLFTYIISSTSTHTISMVNELFRFYGPVYVPIFNMTVFDKKLNWLFLKSFFYVEYLADCMSLKAAVSCTRFVDLIH